MYGRYLRSLVCLGVCCLILGAPSWQPAISAEPRRPNILVILSDDHAVQAIGAYGSRIHATPHIDRLAREGMLFRNAFCANSICGPSRASILTGTHSHMNRVLRNGQALPANQVTFPRLLQQNGYQTALIGKWHLLRNPEGFDHWEVLPDQGHYYNPDFLHADGTRQRTLGYCTDLITEKALDWLKSRRTSDRPFLLMVQHKAPHRNWSPPPRHFSLYRQTAIPEPATLRDDYAGRSHLLAENEMTIRRHLTWNQDMKFQGPNRFPEFFAAGPPGEEYARMTPEQQQHWDAAYEPENQEFLRQMQAGKLSEEAILSWKYQRYIKDYLKCVAAVDDSVGQILDYLDDRGLAPDTLVVYTSDQGFYLGEHGWYDKRWMFEESLRMPLIVRWPGQVAPGTESRALVQNIDYAPTFLELANVPRPATIQGDSLLPLLRSASPQPAWRDAIYYAYYENAAVHHVPVHDGIRTDRYKLMWFPRTGEWQLFDLQTDPHELISVHADPNYAAILKGMQKRYRDLKQYYGVNSAVIPQSNADVEWWRQRHQQTTERARKGGVDLVFLGDSITQSWEGPGLQVWQEFYAHRRPLNLGFSGDRTEHVLWRLQTGNWEGIQPKVAILMVGTNNTGHHLQDPAQIAEGVTAIVEWIRERTPSTKVLLLGVFPRGVHPLDEMRLNNLAVNQYLQRLDDGTSVVYRDLGQVFLEADGSISPEVMPDALHLSPEGYRRWAESIEPLLVSWGL